MGTGSLPAVAPHLTLPASAPVPPGWHVIYRGPSDTFAARVLVRGFAYVVSWCGDYNGDLRIRLAERPGFTFLRSLFVVVG